MKQILKDRDPDLTILAPKHWPIFADLCLVARAVDPKLKSHSRLDSSDSTKTASSGTSDQSKAENNSDRLGGTVLMNALMMNPRQISWTRDELRFGTWSVFYVLHL